MVKYCISLEGGLIWSNSAGLHQICLDACGGVLQIYSGGVLQICGGLIQI